MAISIYPVIVICSLLNSFEELLIRDLVHRYRKNRAALPKYNSDKQSNLNKLYFHFVMPKYIGYEQQGTATMPKDACRACFYFSS